MPTKQQIYEVFLAWKTLCNEQAACFSCPLENICEEGERKVEA
ncbi:hypothetical protein [Pyramidobacter piscolens]|nr:hypothetical protein [Pyramidobacter piscolens]